MSTIELRIDGMTCDHCERAVTRTLSQVPGVTRVVTVSRKERRAVVEGDADLRALAAAVEEEGYQVERAQ